MITGGATMRDRTTQGVCKVPFRAKDGVSGGFIPRSFHRRQGVSGEIPGIKRCNWTSYPPRIVRKREICPKTIYWHPLRGAIGTPSKSSIGSITGGSSAFWPREFQRPIVPMRSSTTPSWSYGAAPVSFEDNRKCRPGYLGLLTVLRSSHCGAMSAGRRWSKAVSRSPPSTPPRRLRSVTGSKKACDACPTSNA